MSHLIHACFLLVQHGRHKGPVERESMRSIFNDVYVRSRSLSYEQREIVSACIDDVLNRHEIAFADLPPFFLTYNTKTMQRSVSCDRVQVEGALLLLFTYLVAKNYDGGNLSEIMFSKIPLSDEFRKHFELDELELHNLLTYSVLNYYDRASASDAADRHSWLTRIVNYYVQNLNTTNVSYVTFVSECLRSLVTASVTSTKNWPWDSRRLSKILTDHAGCDKLSLTMSYELIKYRCFRLDCIRRRDARDMDVNLSEYSLACVSGKFNVWLADVH